VQPYVGSGPYCYSNSLAMMLGDGGPSPSVIEVLTGSPFGFEVLAGHLPLFDPYGWDPDQGLDTAIDLLGWTCRREGAEDDEEAIAKLRDAVKVGTVLVGPVEMGLLLNHPGLGQPIGADHFLLVLDVDDDRVTYHDPDGLPYATLPVPAFLAAWRADTIGYKSTRYTSRSDFRRVREVSEDAALRACLPQAVAWLSQRDDVEVPPGTIGGQDATDRLAEMILAGLDPGVHEHMVHFAIRVGARRLADAATALASLGLHAAADVASEQARLVGSLQYEIVAGSAERAAEVVRTLGPTYSTLAALLKPA
jgi:hypothetical protein